MDLRRRPRRCEEESPTLNIEPGRAGASRRAVLSAQIVGSPFLVTARRCGPRGPQGPVPETQDDPTSSPARAVQGRGAGRPPRPTHVPLPGSRASRYAAAPTDALPEGGVGDVTVARAAAYPVRATRVGSVSLSTAQRISRCRESPATDLAATAERPVRLSQQTGTLNVDHTARDDDWEAQSSPSSWRGRCRMRLSVDGPCPASPPAPHPGAGQSQRRSASDAHLQSNGTPTAASTCGPPRTSSTRIGNCPLGHYPCRSWTGPSARPHQHTTCPDASAATSPCPSRPHESPEPSQPTAHTPPPHYLTEASRSTPAWRPSPHREVRPRPGRGAHEPRSDPNLRLDTRPRHALVRLPAVEPASTQTRTTV